MPSHMSYMFETNSEAVVSMITAWSATVQGTAQRVRCEVRCEVSSEVLELGRDFATHA